MNRSAADAARRRKADAIDGGWAAVRAHPALGRLAQPARMT
jgi:hypothetical protein